MNIIEQIMEAVYELETMNCRKENLIICYSTLVERYLRENLYELHYHAYQSSDYKLKFLMGIETSDRWPYNEIVIYDIKGVSYNPKLLRRISIENATFGRPSKVLE